MNKEIVGITVGKSILITGGLGFIGSKFNSKRIKLLFTNIPYEPKKRCNLGFSKKSLSGIFNKTRFKFIF